MTGGRRPVFPFTALVAQDAMKRALVLNTIATQPGRAAVGIGVVLLGVPVFFVWRWWAGRASGYDLAIISGTTRQEKLYKHLGFIPFGPLVGSDEARFQPMYIPVERFEEMAPVLASPDNRPALNA